MQAYRPAASGEVLRGFVVSGRREGAGFVSVQWVREQLQQLLGDAPYPGTLNVQLRDPQSLAAWHGRAASSAGLVLPAGEPGLCASTYFSVILNGTTRCGIVLPHVPGYPSDVVEMVAADNLRDRIGIGDGDEVSFGWEAAPSNSPG